MFEQRPGLTRDTVDLGVQNGEAISVNQTQPQRDWKIKIHDIFHSLLKFIVCNSNRCNNK